MEETAMTQSEADKGRSRSLSLVSLFDTREAATRAVEQLKAADIGQASISLIADIGAAEEDAKIQSDRKNRLEDFLFPDFDQSVYREGIRRGGHVVTVSGLAADRHNLVRDILDGAGAVDLDERVNAWKADGWSNTQGFLDELQEPPTLIDGDVAASLMRRGQGDNVTTIVTERLQSVKESGTSRSRVRVYTVEYALKAPE
jgi:hypothetical protein